MPQQHRNHYGCGINEHLIKSTFAFKVVNNRRTETVDALVDTGLADLGYRYGDVVLKSLTCSKSGRLLAKE
jgi:hypothetical protein